MIDLSFACGLGLGFSICGFVLTAIFITRSAK
jgi:hypothetical protein